VSPYELAVGLRYTRARKGSGRNTFISFISLMSMAGIALGVAALIVVLSVMNGFSRKLRNRILAVASHIEACAPQLDDWPKIAAIAKQDRRVIGAAPYVLGRRCWSRATSTARIDPRIDPASRIRWPDIGSHMRRGSWPISCPAASVSCWRGESRARAGVLPGDSVVITPQGTITRPGRCRA
jgi:lipoprotein-releasing system permease protein